MLDGIRKELAKVKTEVAEKNAVARALRAQGHRRAPEVTYGKTPDRRVVRMYLWRDTPLGNLCLVTGPSVEGNLYELHPHTGGAKGDVYFPRKGNAPALSTRRTRNTAYDYGEVPNEEYAAYRMGLMRMLVNAILSIEYEIERGFTPQGRPVVGEKDLMDDIAEFREMLDQETFALGTLIGDQEAADFRGSLENDQALRAAVRKVGADFFQKGTQIPLLGNPKEVRGKVYVHKSAVKDLGPKSEKRAQRAARVAGNPDFDVVRIDPDGAVMLGRTSTWERSNPELLESWLVRDGKVAAHRTYSPGKRPRYHKTALMKKNPAPGAGGTAIVRNGPSAPVRWLEERDLIRSPVLDFGSGHGEDAAWLRAKGYQVREYDPNFEGVSRLPTGTYNTVLAIYVLNVLPKSKESSLLKQIRATTRKGGTAYIAVRSDVRRAGKTSRGYQRPVKLDMDVEGSPSGARIYAMEKGPKRNPQSVEAHLRWVIGHDWVGEGHDPDFAAQLVEGARRDLLRLESTPAVRARLDSALDAREQARFGRRYRAGFSRENPRAPKPPIFESPMISLLNMKVHGWGHPDPRLRSPRDYRPGQSSSWLLDDIIAGKKPSGWVGIGGNWSAPGVSWGDPTLHALKEEHARKMWQKAKDAGLTVSPLVADDFEPPETGPWRWSFTAAYETPVAEAFDLDAWERTWVAHYGLPLLTARKMRKAVERSGTLFGLAELAEEYEDNDPLWPHKLPVIGLALGFPLEETAKILMGHRLLNRGLPMMRPARSNPHRPATALKRIKAALRQVPRRKGQHPADDLCYPASEAFYHAVGGKKAGYTPMQIRHEGESHWWVRGPEGEVYDLTEGQFRTAVPHERSRGRGFLTAKPSERAQDLLALAQLRTNPQAKVGRVRKDKEGKKYVLWRPVLPDGSRPRIYLSAEEPMDAELIEVTEAAAELQHAKKVVDKREKEAKKKGLRGIWKGGSKRKIVYSKPKAKPMLRSGTKTPLFDSEGKEYRVTYAAVPTQLDGMGPVLASSLPETFEETPGYPTVFQARSLQRTGEASKIRKIARGLDPDKLLLPNADATLGAPVVWEGDGKSHRSGDTSVKTEKGVYYVLGGNGRVLAILMAPTDRYQSYVQRARSLWPDVWPPGGSPEGDRNVLVRVVTKPDGSPLTFAQARTLAGRTQKSAAGEESPIGRALSLIRSLGIERVSDLPSFKWDGIIIQDNVKDFTAANPAFTAAVLDSLGGARAKTYAEDTALSSELFNNLMVGYLPRRFQLQGFVGEKQERALLTALPIIVSLHQGVLQNEVAKKWDLLPLLDSASRFAQMVKPLSDKKTVALVEAAAAQVQLGEGTEMAEKFKSLFDELPLLAVMFGVVLKKGEKARDPAITVEKFLVPYAIRAASVPEESPKRIEFAMGQAPPGHDPALVLAGLLGMEIPGAVRPTSVSQMQMVANPRPRYEIGDTVFFHQWSDSKGWQKTEGTVVAEREHPRPKMSLRSGTPMQYRVRSHATNRKRWINDRDMRAAPLAQQRLLNRKGQLRLRVAASRILERLYLRGTTGYAANKEGRFPPGVDELLDKGLVQRVECVPGAQTLYGTDTCTLALTARGRKFAKNRRRAARTHAAARQGRMFNPDMAVTGYQEPFVGKDSSYHPRFHVVSNLDWQQLGFRGRKAKARAIRHALELRPDLTSEWHAEQYDGILRVRGIGPEGQFDGWVAAPKEAFIKKDGSPTGRNEGPDFFVVFDRSGNEVRIPVTSLEGATEAQIRMWNPADPDDEEPESVIAVSDWDEDDELHGIDTPGEPGRQTGLYGGVSYADADYAPEGNLTILNMGLGRDSITMLCLLVKGELLADGKYLGPDDVDAVVFSDTGAEWEHTYRLIPRVEAFSKKHGIRFLVLEKPEPGSKTGVLLERWLEAMKEGRKETEAGWEVFYQENVAPLYRKAERERAEMDKEKKVEVAALEKEAKAKGMDRAQTSALLAPVRKKWAAAKDKNRKAARRQAAKWKKEGGYQFKAERAWWAPGGADRRLQYDTIEGRAAAGVYHLRPEILVDFGWKGTIPLRSDKSCTGNHKVAPIRKVTEDLAVEKFGPWATNRNWGVEVRSGRRTPHVNLIGLAADETDRLAKGGDVGCFTASYVTEAYPLAEMGIAKPDEQAYLDACGFGDVRKSGCWMCPYQPIGWWWALSVLYPRLFDRAARAELESTRRDPKLYFAGGGMSRKAQEKADRKEGARVDRDATMLSLREQKKAALAEKRTEAKAKGLKADEYKPLLKAVREEYGFLMDQVKADLKDQLKAIDEEYASQRLSLLLPEAVEVWRERHPDADPDSVLQKQYAKCAIKFPKKTKKNPVMPPQGCCSDCDRFVNLWLQFGIPGSLDRMDQEPERNRRNAPRARSRRHRNSRPNSASTLPSDPDSIYRTDGRLLFPTATDVFAGAGLLTLALEMEGAAIVQACEADDGTGDPIPMKDSVSSLATLRLHVWGTDGPLEVCDALEWTPMVPDQGLDLLAGGPPCQPWSGAGAALGAKDPRDMFPQVVRWARESRPRVVCMENVIGIMADKFAGYRAWWWGEMKKAGYEGTVWTLNAADFGTPQQRRRVFFVAWPIGASWGAALRAPPPPTHRDPRKPPSMFGDLPHWVTASHRLQTGCCGGFGFYSCVNIGNLANSCSNCLQGSHYQMAENEEEVELTDAMVRSKVSTKKALEGQPLTDMYGIVTLGEPERQRKLGAKTAFVYSAPVVTKSWRKGVPYGLATTSETMPRSSYDSDFDWVRTMRFLTVREVAKLQDVPAWYKFAPGATAYKKKGNWKDYEPSTLRGRMVGQIGNGVPVNLGRAVARKIFEALGYTDIPFRESPEKVGTERFLHHRFGRFPLEMTGMWPLGDEDFCAGARLAHSLGTKRRGIVYGVGELYGGPQYIQNRLKKEGHWIDLFGPKGAPIPGEKGYKPPPDLGKAWGGESPFVMADRMVGNALTYMEEQEMALAYCVELRDIEGVPWNHDCALEEATREDLELTLAELVGAPERGPSGNLLTEDDKAWLSINAVKAAMETREDLWGWRLPVEIGASKSRKGPTKPILAPRGESGGSQEVPYWAARAMMTDWLVSLTPGYKQDLRLVNIDKKVASAFIEAHHSALPYLNARGMLYALGLYKGDRLVAVATANTPTGNLSREARVVAGGLDPHNVVELTRVASDGSVKGAASKLVSRLITILERSKRGDPDAPGMLVTFQLTDEKGTSYKALQDRGLRPVALVKGSKPSGARAGGEYSGDPALAKLDKIRWECCAEPPALRADWALVREEQQRLFNPLGVPRPPLRNRRQRTNPRHRAPTEVQSLMFSKGKFTGRSALKWAKEHGFPSKKVHETAKLFRVRVSPPGVFHRGALRTITIDEGVRAVVGPPRR